VVEETIIEETDLALVIVVTEIVADAVQTEVVQETDAIAIAEMTVTEYVNNSSRSCNISHSPII
jgi:hypothetical protein